MRDAYGRRINRSYRRRILTPRVEVVDTRSKDELLRLLLPRTRESLTHYKSSCARARLHARTRVTYRTYVSYSLCARASHERIACIYAHTHRARNHTRTHTHLCAKHRESEFTQNVRLSWIQGPACGHHHPLPPSSSSSPSPSPSPSP